MKTKIALAFCFALATFAAGAQSLADSFKPPIWASYVFVSSAMPRAAVLQLAKEASLTKSTLVLRGFDEKTGTLDGAKAYVADINANCCGKNPPSWTIHPKLYETFGIKFTPAFVLAKGINPSSNDFALVSGDIGLPNALKFFAQRSTNSEVRTKASEIYTKSFSSN